MKRVAKYRIRWAKVIGPWRGRRRMCIAEKRVRFFWLFPIWWPVEHAEWRLDENACQADINFDIKFSLPMPAPKVMREVGSK